MSLSLKAYSRSGGSNCVLHKHCIEKSKTKSPERVRQSSSTPSPENTSTCSSAQSSPNINGSPFQWQFSRKRKYSRNLHRHRRHGTKGRPNSLLLPIDESEELQELVQTTNTNDLAQNMAQNKPNETTLSSIHSPSIDVQKSDNVRIEDKRPVVHQMPTPSSSLLSSSRFSTTLMKAKNWIKRGKVSAQ